MFSESRKSRQNGNTRNKQNENRVSEQQVEKESIKKRRLSSIGQQECVGGQTTYGWTDRPNDRIVSKMKERKRE